MEETSTAIAEFKRKCEKKVKEIKEKYREEVEEKDKTAAQLQEDILNSTVTTNQEMEKLKEAVRK